MFSLPPSSLIRLTNTASKSVMAFVEKGKQNNKIEIQTLTAFEPLHAHAHLKLELFKTLTPLKRLYDAADTDSISKRFFRTILDGTSYYVEQKTEIESDGKSELTAALNKSQRQVVEKFSRMEEHPLFWP